MGKLTLKQRKFADEYIITGNATESAIRAGYSKKTAAVIGTENLIKPNIKKYIDERLEEIQSQKVADQREVLEYLSSIMRGEEREQTLIGLGMGEQGKTMIQVAAKERIKAAELLGKRYAMWTDKQQVDVVIPVFVEDVPDDD